MPVFSPVDNPNTANPFEFGGRSAGGGGAGLPRGGFSPAGARPALANPAPSSAARPVYRVGNGVGTPSSPRNPYAPAYTPQNYTRPSYQPRSGVPKSYNPRPHAESVRQRWSQNLRDHQTRQERYKSAENQRQSRLTEQRQRNLENQRREQQQRNESQRDRQVREGRQLEGERWRETNRSRGEQQDAWLRLRENSARRQARQNALDELNRIQQQQRVRPRTLSPNRVNPRPSLGAAPRQIGTADPRNYEGTGNPELDGPPGVGRSCWPIIHYLQMWTFERTILPGKKLYVELQFSGRYRRKEVAGYAPGGRLRLETPPFNLPGFRGLIVRGPISNPYNSTGFMLGDYAGVNASGLYQPQNPTSTFYDPNPFHAVVGEYWPGSIPEVSMTVQELTDTGERIGPLYRFPYPFPPGRALTLPPGRPRPDDDMQCRYSPACSEACIQEILQKIRRLENVLLAQTTLLMCGPQSPPQSRVSGTRVEAMARALEYLAKEQCQNYPALIPDHWPVRLGANRPQLVLSFQKLDDATRQWQVSIPHYKFGPNDRPAIPQWTRGNHYALIYLKDNSKIHLHGKDKAELERIVPAFNALVKDDLRFTPPKVTYGERRGNRPVQQVQVKPAIAKFFDQGQANLKPLWTIDFRERR